MTRAGLREEELRFRGAIGALVVSLSIALAGCARPQPEHPAECEEISVPATTAQVASPPAPVGFQYGTPDTPASAVDDATPSRFRVRRIGALSDEVPRRKPSGGRRVDIDLVKAPFDDAVRLLADTGRFNVVVEAPGASPVTVRLSGVDPFDALIVIAEARGLEVRFERGIVVVGAPRKDSSP